MKQELHRKNMIDILMEIYKDPFLAHNLYFKGGTALYLFHDLPRFSTDLDFDLNSDCKDKNKILEKIKFIASKFGALQESIVKRNTILLILSYEKYHRLIKIEISTRDPGAKAYEIKNIFGTDIKVLQLDFICSGKLLALTERTKARDLFDAYFILINELPVNEKILKIYSGKTIKQFFKFLEGKVKKSFSRKNVLHELGEMIEDNKKNWIRDKLQISVLDLIKQKLEKL